MALASVQRFKGGFIMVHRLSRSLLLGAAGTLLFLTVLALGFLIKASPPQAQAPNVMAVPACQCSPPTSVLGTGSGPRVVHCVCGALSCAISLPAGTAPDSHQLQCMR
jgi:hypothetical protein